MSQGEIHVGDIGTVIGMTIYDEQGAIVDVSSASVKYIIFYKHDGTTVNKSAEFTTDGTDGKIQYTTIAGDLNVGGIWKKQGYVVLSAGTWYTNKINFTVHNNLTVI